MKARERVEGGAGGRGGGCGAGGGRWRGGIGKGALWIVLFAGVLLRMGGVVGGERVARWRGLQTWEGVRGLGLKVVLGRRGRGGGLRGGAGEEEREVEEEEEEGGVSSCLDGEGGAREEEAVMLEDLGMHEEDDEGGEGIEGGGKAQKQATAYAMQGEGEWGEEEMGGVEGEGAGVESEDPEEVRGHESEVGNGGGGDEKDGGGAEGGGGAGGGGEDTERECSAVVLRVGDIRLNPNPTPQP